MRFEDTGEVGFGVDDEMVAVLVNIKAIVILEKTEVMKGRLGFARKLDVSTNAGVDLLSERFGRTGQSKVIDLAEEEDLVTIVGSRIDGLVMGSGLEVEVRMTENAVDVILPEAAGFRVAL